MSIKEAPRYLSRRFFYLVYPYEMHEIQSLVPQDKYDIERAEAAVAAGYPAVAPILPELLEWLQDCNWPVAHVLSPFLESIGSPLIPHVRNILATDDEVWKYWIINRIIRGSRELAEEFHAEVERIAYSPTENEALEELHETALRTIEEYGWQR